MSRHPYDALGDLAGRARSLANAATNAVRMWDETGGLGAGPVGADLDLAVAIEEQAARTHALAQEYTQALREHLSRGAR